MWSYWIVLLLQTSAAYVLFYRRYNDGGPRVRILDRSLSQSFAEEVERRGAKFQPKQESMEEEEEMPHTQFST